MRATRFCTSMGLAAMMAATPALVQAQARAFQFDLPTQSLGASLRGAGRVAREQIIFDGAVVRGRNAPALKGSYSFDAALHVLLERTDLSATRSANGVWRVTRTQNPVSTTAQDRSDIVVTGSRIANANPTSPVHVVTRKEIAQSGYSQIGDVVRALPENFSGGQNPGVFDDPNNSQNENVSNATSLNLRGIGSGATLSLVEGYRLPGDSLFQAADISGIPLGAVERIEVITDGASAVYGSDAVAGVANILLRKNLNGLETSARVGTATQGGATEQTYSAVAGLSGSRGYVTAAGEYSWQDPFRASQRDYLSGMNPVNMLLQRQLRRSALVTGRYDLTDRLSISALGIFSHRKSYSETANTPTTDVTAVDGRTQNYGGSLALDYRLDDDWKVHVAGSYLRSDNRLTYATAAIGFTRTIPYYNDVAYGEASVTGSPFTLPGGDVQLAFGGGYRGDRYRRSAIFASRTVPYLFGEALIPVVAPSAERNGLNELDISLAIRSENYSDFGKTTNPKVGLRWKLLPDLTLRGTWARSFKAPSFGQSYGATYAFLSDATDYNGGTVGTVMFLSGGNRDLKPERAKSWTVGAEYARDDWAKLKLNATWFHIDYTDRIVEPVYNVGNALSDAVFAPFVIRTPSVAQAQSAWRSVSYGYDYSSTGYDPAQVSAIVFDQYANASFKRVQGIDIGCSQDYPLYGGRLSPFANASWLNLKQRTLVTLPIVTLSGQVFNPPSFKARAGFNWAAGGFSATGIANHLSGFTDTGVTPSGRVSSWTTFDATLAYDLKDAAGLWRGIRLALSASNLFDRDPPRVASASGYYQGLVFDSANASALGRFVSFTITKAW